MDKFISDYKEGCRAHNNAPSADDFKDVLNYEYQRGHMTSRMAELLANRYTQLNKA